MSLPPALEGRLQDLLTCLLFYTRLPVGRWNNGDTNFAAAQWAAPVVGIIVGICGGVVFVALSMAGSPAGVSAGICIAVVILLTGALHEDGAADTADGFGGGRTVEQKLEIMRDSRLGTFGALTLVISVLLRWSALSDLAQPVHAVAVLVAAHAASRALIAGFLMQLPPARSDGLGAGVGHIGAGTAFVSLVIGALALLLAGPATAVICAAGLAIWFFALRTLCLRQIGGQTGDIAGALQQGGEVLILVIAASLAG